MLSSMVKEHHAKQVKRKQEQGIENFMEIISFNSVNENIFFLEIKRKEAIEASNDLTKALVEHLNVGYVRL